MSSHVSRLKDNKNFLESPKKLLEIMEYVVRNPASVSTKDVARNFSMSISNAFKYLKLLEEYGFVVKNQEKKYVPGFKFVDFGSVVLRRVELREIARSYLFDLLAKTHQTVNLVVRDGDMAVYVDKIECAESMPLMSRIGMQMPLYSTSFGKAILAHFTEEELEKYFARVELLRKTNKTIVERQKLIEHLKEVREKGYAIDDEENEYGVRCIGCAILNHEGRPIGAVSIAGSKNKLTMKLIRKYATSVISCASEISKKLGYADSIPR
ncbi:IclR family transcriptional regulator [Pseudothermotoga sp. U03pept]|uniref:IclR family transcriptional regulator n=1 Tax=Pseudothermotoga sp. U03pept TaxID=3447012 RepID=UPI003F0997F4